MNMGEYLAEKFEVLQDFGVKLNYEQLIHLVTLKSETAIDNYCRPLILAELA